MFAFRANVAEPLTGTVIDGLKTKTLDALGGVSVVLGEPPHEVQVSVIDENIEG